MEPVPDLVRPRPADAERELDAVGIVREHRLVVADHRDIAAAGDGARGIGIGDADDASARRAKISKRRPVSPNWRRSALMTRSSPFRA